MVSPSGVNATAPSYVELEIGLRRVEAETYEVELRFTDPTSDAELPPERGTAPLDLDLLLALRQNGGTYGQALADGLFHDENVRLAYARARAAAAAGGSLLRVRVQVGRSALELHALYWELLCDPESKAPLATSEKTLFSRFMLTRDYRPVRLRPKAELAALVAVSAPGDADRYGLATIDVESEVRRARESLAGIAADVAGLEEPLTLQRLIARLRAGVDILYLVCHGVLARQQIPYLFLQDDEGNVERVEGEKLARAVAELRDPPRLVVLASCHSASCQNASCHSAKHGNETGKANAKASLAWRLAEAGVPAILAMQDRISLKTVERALPIFFRELLEDGQIDRAMAVARAAVRERHDAWVPALYLRLKGGRIWYVPGFSGENGSSENSSGEDGDFSKWRSIVSSVRQGTFIPIVGIDVSEHVFGTAHELADQLSERHAFPMERHERVNLPKVAQFLSVDESRKYARDELLELLRQRILQRHPEILETADGDSLTLPKLLDAIVSRLGEDDPFRILARLPASVYVTASFDPMLLKSIKAAGREPMALLCDWRPSESHHPRKPVCDDEPTAKKPAVYHVFGVLGKPSSLVLTEDDFFDHLIATSEFKLIPTAVRGALIRSSLLFLGFRLDYWTFRVLFRLIMTLGGSQQLRDFAHVGVQVNPEEHSLGDVERARKYLKESFGAGRDAPPISIYWGSAADFLKELREQLARAGDEAPPPAEDDEDDWFS